MNRRLAYQALLSTPNLFLKSPIPGVELFDASKLPIPSAPLPENKRLGKFLEEMLLHSIQASNRYQIIYHSKQVVENGRTLGEIDFLLYDKSDDCLIHLEMAYKFYLFLPGITGYHFPLLGPKLKDSLDAKLRKLRERQFPLIYHHQFKKELAGKRLKQKLWLPAQLFCKTEETTGLPENINPQCVVGQYHSANHLDTVLKDSIFSYIPGKKEWFLPASISDGQKTSSTAENILELTDQGQSPMLWIKKPENNLVKLFITHFIDY